MWCSLLVVCCRFCCLRLALRADAVMWWLLVAMCRSSVSAGRCALFDVCCLLFGVALLLVVCCLVLSLFAACCLVLVDV